MFVILQRSYQNKQYWIHKNCFSYLSDLVLYLLHQWCKGTLVLKITQDTEYVFVVTTVRVTCMCKAYYLQERKVDTYKKINRRAHISFTCLRFIRQIVITGIKIYRHFIRLFQYPCKLFLNDIMTKQLNYKQINNI